jgi:hypothetical protein
MKHHRTPDRIVRLALYATVSAAAALMAAACSKDSAPPTTPTCVVTIGQTATAIPAAGATGSIAVNTTSGCAWTATSGATFITITQGAAGTGNGAVQFTVAPNSGAARTGTLTVAGTTITFTQAAALVDTPTLAAPHAQSPAGGQVVDTLTPTLVVANSAATGAVGAVTYRFEVSDQDSFPDGIRTIAAEAVAQGSGNTAWTVPQSLASNTTYFWRARANGASVASPFSNVETFRTPVGCSYTLSSTTIAVSNAGGSSTVDVTAPAGCAWTAASNAAFITITAGAIGTGNGTVTISVTPSGGVGRSATLTIAGQTVTVNQAGSAVIASFNLLDPSTTAGPTTECRFRSLTSSPSTCTLTSTSFPLGPTAVVNFAWTVKYTYVTEKVLTQNGANPQFSFSDLCGQAASTNEGAPQPLEVTLTVTDSAGNTATATSGTGGQPALTVRLFACGI